MDLYDNMSAYKVSSVAETTNKDSMLDGKNLLFMTGFCVGMLFFYLAGDAFSIEVGQMYIEILQQIKRMNPETEGLFMYILDKRMRQAFILGIMATGKLSKPIFYIVITVAGFTTGTLMLLAAYQLGFLGILVSVGMVFPQMILYFKVFQVLFEEHYYGNHGNTRHYHKGNMITQDSWHNIRDISIKFFKVIAYIMVGVYLETYINTWLLQKLLLFL